MGDRRYGENTEEVSFNVPDDAPLTPHPPDAPNARHHLRRVDVHCSWGSTGASQAETTTARPSATK